MKKLSISVVFFALFCCCRVSNFYCAAKSAGAVPDSATPATASTLSEEDSNDSSEKFKNPQTNGSVSESIRVMCKEAQQLEQDISFAEADIRNFNRKEKNTAPILKSTYKLLARCFTLLLNIQRFSKFLTISPQEEGRDKNDFVRCSIIIKNFSGYFNVVSSELAKNTNEIMAIKKKRQERSKELVAKKIRHVELEKLIKQTLPERVRGGEESMIENVVYHIATKSNSLEELDAELESENAVGVLKNTKVNTELSLVHPVSGKLVSEFGDKSKSGDMVCSISFETRKGAIITSPAKGLVVFSGKFLNYGNMIIISNGDYRVFLYGLSDDVYVTTGDIIEIGDYIGTMSSEPKAGNPIIEMELRKFGEPLDPRHWLMQTMDKGLTLGREVASVVAAPPST